MPHCVSRVRILVQKLHVIDVQRVLIHTVNRVGKNSLISLKVVSPEAFICRECLLSMYAKALDSRDCLSVLSSEFSEKHFTVSVTAAKVVVIVLACCEE